MNGFLQWTESTVDITIRAFLTRNVLGFGKNFSPSSSDLETSNMFECISVIVFDYGWSHGCCSRSDPPLLSHRKMEYDVLHEFDFITVHRGKRSADRRVLQASCICSRISVCCQRNARTFNCQCCGPGKVSSYFKLSLHFSALYSRLSQSLDLWIVQL